MSRLGSSVAIVTICLGVTGLGACGTASQTPPPGTSSPQGTTTSPSSVMKPHLAKRSGGHALPTGWLWHLDQNGGF